MILNFNLKLLILPEKETKLSIKCRQVEYDSSNISIDLLLKPLG